MGFGASVFGKSTEDTAIYAGIPYAADFGGFMWFIIHEYAHSIANPIADIWYAENAEFRQWADESVDPVRRPGHAMGFIMAREYVTEAYTIWYSVKNQSANLVLQLLRMVSEGLPHIAEVYAMVTGTEPIDLRRDVMGVVLKTDFTIDTTVHSFDLGGQIIKWRFVDLLGHTLTLEEFTFSSFGDILNTQLGDIIVVSLSGEPSMWIDIGSGEGIGGRDASFRQYSIFPLFKELDFFFD
jgi:hypothetical protein